MMKKMKFSILMIVACLYLSCGLDSDNYTDSSSTDNSRNITVESVELIKEHSNAWAVKGMIRNNTSSDINGAVKIKFLNSKGDIVYNNRAFVNDGDPIQPGQAGNFVYYTDPYNFEGVTDFDVQFYER